MTLDEAYEILGLKSSASEAERYQVFREKQVALEDRITKAPTLGLQEKYRAALKQYEAALELIELSEDGGLLPVTKPEWRADSDVELTAEHAESAEHERSVSAAGNAKGFKLWKKHVVVLLCVCLCGFLVWWFGIVQPRAAEAAYLVVAEQIEMIEETASDVDLAKVDRVVVDYREGASSKYATLATKLWAERQALVQASRDAEAARLQAEAKAAEEAEAARIEAAGKVAEAEKLKAEQLALENAVSRDLDALKAATKGLAAHLLKEQQVLQDLKRAQRHRSEEKSELRKAYEALRILAQASYVSELEASNRSHPVLLAIANAEAFQADRDFKAAAKVLEAGKTHLPRIASDLLKARANKQVHTTEQLLDWAKQQNSAAIMWLQKDEPKLSQQVIDALRTELGYLDQGARVKSNALERLGLLARWVGRQDADYVRWFDQVLPDLRVESTPTGASVTDRNGRSIGTTPLLLRNASVGTYDYTVSLSQHEPANFQFISELGAANQTKQLPLKWIPTYIEFRPFPNMSLWKRKYWRYSVFIDGSRVLRAEKDGGKFPVEPGVHTVKVVLHIRLNWARQPAEGATEEDVYLTNSIQVHVAERETADVSYQWGILSDEPNLESPNAVAAR